MSIRTKIKFLWYKFKSTFLRIRESMSIDISLVAAAYVLKTKDGSKICIVLIIGNSFQTVPYDSKLEKDLINLLGSYFYEEFLDDWAKLIIPYRDIIELIDRKTNPPPSPSNKNRP